MLNKRRSSIIAICLIGMILLGMANVSAFAERVSTVTLEQVQRDIRAQIQYGLEYGFITPEEARVFYRRERDIQFRDSQYRQNPQASPRERDAIWRDLDAMRFEVDRKLSGTQGGVSGRNQKPLRIDQRQAQINDRINRGIAAGLIMPSEAHQLQQRQADLSRREAQLLASGNLNPIERDRLHRELDRLEWELNRLLDHADRYRQ